ncbi:30S ribosome-binding factor RbfA [Thermodesulfobacteriota bacterium]
MEFKRADRVAELIRSEISSIVQREISDPLLSMATITLVKLSDDLKNARVYFVCDSKRQKSAKKGFDRSLGFIKKQLSSRLKLRYMPRITFYYDDSFDYSSNIDKLLKEVKVEDDQ